MRLTRVAMMAVAGSVLWLLAQHQVSALRSGQPLNREFMAFYAVGHVLNRAPATLYEPSSFLRAYRDLFPHVPEHVQPLYAHAPFEAVVFRPFALLPFPAALVAWQIFSLALFCAGMILVWRFTSLPAGGLPLALLLGLSFEPVSLASVLVGQVSGLAFFWMAVAIACQRRGWDHAAGAALAVCLSKPTLLALALPMLVVGRLYRTLAGLLGGAAILAVLSVLAVGWHACVEYARILLRFAGGPPARPTRSPICCTTSISIPSRGW